MKEKQLKTKSFSEVLPHNKFCEFLINIKVRNIHVYLCISGYELSV